MFCRLWNWLFCCCKHDWKIIKEAPLMGIAGGRGDRYIIQCTKCGWIKKRDML